ncbi:MAG: DNA replication and repair protein RecF [bacterium]
MHILAASLSGFRNLHDDAFEFSPRVNLVLGRNGEGKTNFLEALNYFALGRSHRGSRNEDLIGFHADALHVHLDVAGEDGAPFTCDYGIDRGGDRRFRLDGELVTRRSDLVGKLVTVFFNPDSSQLVRGGPQFRRQYLDQGQAEIDPEYLRDLGSFQRALKQKAALLRDLRRGIADGRETRREVKAWNRELARCAATVCLGRREQAGLLEPFAQLSHNNMLDKDLKLEMIYRPRLESVRGFFASQPEIPGAKNDLAEEICREIDYITELEIKRGRPLAGPQFDDLEVRLDGVDLRGFGSQGETRTAAIALILARSDVLFQKRRIRPVLFLDDIFSELDRERSHRLQDMASREHQLFIATARSDDVAGRLPGDPRTWSVESGRLRRQS